MMEEDTDNLWFQVGSNELNDFYFNMTCTFFDCLLNDDESGAAAFLKELNEFSQEEFFMFCEEIKRLKNKDLELNDKKISILVAAIYYVCHAFLDEAEMSVLSRMAGESEEELREVRKKFLDFGSYIISYVKPKFTSLPRFARTIHWLETHDL